MKAWVKYWTSRSSSLKCVNKIIRGSLERKRKKPITEEAFNNPQQLLQSTLKRRDYRQMLAIVPILKTQDSLNICNHSINFLQYVYHYYFDRLSLNKVFQGTWLIRKYVQNKNFKWSYFLFTTITTLLISIYNYYTRYLNYLSNEGN